MGRALAALIALLLLAGPAGAEPPASLLPAFLELGVNGVRGETSLVHLDGEDVWVAVHDLTRAGLTFAGVRRTIADRPAVSLRSLAPDLRFEVDEEALVLRIHAGPALLGRRRLDLSAARRPDGIETRTATSAFLNYTGRATTREELSGSFEAGVSAGTGLLQGQVSATRDGGAVRGLTSLWVDEPRRLVRFVAGDAVTLPDALGGAPILGGLALVRELSLDPYLVRAPLPGATAFASTPSVLEVYVNGALARTQEVTPGNYDLSLLPVTAGASDVRVLVRDAFGRTQEVETAHYQAQGLLARGLHDWAVHVGAVRRAFGRESFDYGDPVLLARFRSGFGERLTAGFRLDLGPRVRSGGLSATAALPVGQLDLAGAVSDDEGELGGAGLLAWQYGSRRVTLGADATVRSRAYATSTLRAADDRPLWRASARATVPVLAGAALTVQWSGVRLRDHGTSQRLEARTSLSVAARTWLVLSAAAEREGAGAPSGSAFVQVVVGGSGDTTADAGGRLGRGGEPGGTLGAQRSLPPGPGVGWRVRGDTAGEGTVNGLLQVQPAFGRYEAAYDRAYGPNGSEVGSLSAAGGVVLVGERLFATRPVEQSFALVRVPGISGVRVRLEQQEVGRTGSGGDLLVPGLLPYYGNRLSIADTDVPADFRIGRVERVVAPRPRGAAVVRFEVERLRAVEGRVRLGGRRGARIPAWGTLEVDTPRGTHRSPIAEGGEFWLEDLPSGTHAARVYFEGDVCEFGLSVPESGPGVVDVGTLGCAER
jgi:outer membrane usher protein